MSTIYPPESQQSPPQPPPLPPHRSWPRRHKILTALGSAFGLLIVLIVVIAVTSAPSITKPNTPVAAPATPAQATPTAEQPALFPLREDCRPAAERSADGRYLEPSLFTLLERPR